MALELPGCLGINRGGINAFVPQLLPYCFNIMLIDI